MTNAPLRGVRNPYRLPEAIGRWEKTVAPHPHPPVILSEWEHSSAVWSESKDPFPYEVHKPLQRNGSFVALAQDGSHFAHFFHHFPPSFPAAFVNSQIFKKVRNLA